MMRLISITVLCLMLFVTVNADEVTMSARELAETRLLAEWVGVPEKQFILGNVYYKGEGTPAGLCGSRHVVSSGGRPGPGGIPAYAGRDVRPG